MIIENDNLIITTDLYDDKLEELISMAQLVSVKQIVVEKVVLTSLIVQMLLALSKDKKVIFRDKLMDKFFENIIFSE